MARGYRQILGVSMAEPQKEIPIIFICREDIDLSMIDANVHVRESEKSFPSSPGGKKHAC
jgi:hypothetical protein